MSVVIETSIGDLVIDLYIDERPNCCKNFLKLCKIKYYHYSLFYNVQKNYVAQTGDPTGTGRGGESIFSFAYGDQAKYFEMERFPKIKHKKKGCVSMINNGNDLHGSQFLITLNSDLDYLDGKHTVFGEVAKGFDVIEKLNECICDKEDKPYQDIRIFHTVILDDPFEDFAALSIENGRASPEPTDERLNSDRIRVDEEVDQLDGMSQEEIDKYMREKEAKTRAKLLEIIGDIPDADIKPPENVLFVCKLNPVTNDEDLELIFSRFGKINSCEVIRDRKTGDSLCYAFIEFDREEDCENAYFKMDNVLIDDRRIHVDFSQSVSKVTWKGKGTGSGYFEDNRNYKNDTKNVKNEKYRFNDTKSLNKKQGYDLVFDENEAISKKYESIKRDHSYRDKRQSSEDSRNQRNDHKNLSHSYRERDSYRDRDQDRRGRDRDADNQSRHNKRSSSERDRDRDRRDYGKDEYDSHKHYDEKNRHKEKRKYDDHKKSYSSSSRH